MSTPEIEVVNLNNLEKIQNFLNDSAYKEILENSETYNTRLCIERRLRMPFLDPQTGVAQTHCSLFMSQRQRMPGFRDGQIYTYPSARWRKPKRQYLLNHHHSYRTYQYRENAHHHHASGSAATTLNRDHHQTDNPALTADGNSMSASGDNDSKDSHANAEKEWFHEDLDMSHHHHFDDFEDDFESDNDFDESYNSRGKRKRATRWRKSIPSVDGTPKRGRKGGGGTRRRGGATEGGGGGDYSMEPIRRRRGGGASGSMIPSANTVISNMSHSNSASPITNTDDTSQSALPMASTNNSVPVVVAVTTTTATATTVTQAETTISTTTSNTEPVNSTASDNNASVPPTVATNQPTPLTVASGSCQLKNMTKSKVRATDREVAQPSPYCDFCLGDQHENKKTNLPEELVSCSDCGRSGHPSCLQFTPNMIISVKRYRWQCIECKFCSICGTSDNDDQLLFCDDCDRGYHMYCLSPPLVTPPEGSWSCKLCMEEFHKGAETN